MKVFGISASLIVVAVVAYWLGSKQALKKVTG